ncbi:Uncharacterised protein g8297 [Pycnogonum litorale]
MESVEENSASRQKDRKAKYEDSQELKRGYLVVSKMLREQHGPPSFKMEKSSVLKEIKDFLPKMKEANVDLQKKLQHEDESKNLDIENVNDTDGPIIEMNLAVVQNDDDSTNDETSDNDTESSSDGDDTKEPKPLIEVIKDNKCS